MKRFTDDASGTELLVFAKGEELMAGLDSFAREQAIDGAWVDIVGGAAAVTLGFYDPVAREYRWRSFEEPLEITGLHGDLSWVDGEPAWHVHGSFSRADFSVLGGHVKRCLIGLTGEVMLTPRRTRLTRVYDEETGLKLLSEP